MGSAGDGDYNFHAEDLIETFKQLDKHFISEKAEDEYNKIIETKTAEKETKEGELKEKEEAKSEQDEKLGKASEDMIEENGKLVDDQKYLKVLTEQCEVKAREWDQRSQMRHEEVEALNKALDIIKMKVKDASDQVNKRALLQESVKPVQVPVDESPTDTFTNSDIGDIA